MGGPGPLGRPGTAPTGKPSVREALRFGWDTLKANTLFFVLVSLALFLAYRAIALAQQLFEKDNALIPALIVFVLVLPLSLIIGMGYIRVALKFCDNEKGTVADLVGLPPFSLRFVGGSIAYGAATVGTFVVAEIAVVLLVLQVRQLLDPSRSLIGVIALTAAAAVAIALSIRLLYWVFDRQFFGHVIVDRQLGTRAALKRSASIARGARWRLAIFDALPLAAGLVVGVLNLLLSDEPLTIPGTRYTVPIPSFGAAFPPAVSSAMREFVGYCALVAGWPTALAHAFFYRQLDARVEAQDAGSAGVQKSAI